MKKIAHTLLGIVCISLLIASISTAVCAAPQGKAKGVRFESYAMDNDYFSCKVPADWTLERDKDKDEDYKIYEIQLLAPKADKAPTSVFVSYYAKENEDFSDFQNFISRNSTNVFGETKSVRENYEPLKRVTVAGRKGFELSNEVMEYLNPQSKSDESVQLKEKMYVLPAKDGFYVLKYSAQKSAFIENLPVFEKIAKSFKGKP